MLAFRDDERGAPTAPRREAGREERYRSFVMQSSDAMWCFETDEPVRADLPVGEIVDAIYRLGRLVECNEAMARMYRATSSDALVGVRLDDLLPRDEPRNVEYLA